MRDGLESGAKIDRRRFLALAAGALAGAIGATMAIPSLFYVLAPGFGKKDEEWVDLGATKDIPKGQPVKLEYVRRRRDGWTIVEAKGSAWVSTANGREFTVFDPHCTHLGCAYRWDAAKDRFLCPCHTAVFQIDGTVLSGPPPRPLDRLPNKVVGDRLLVMPTAAGKAA